MYKEAIMKYERNGWARPLTEDEAKVDVKPVYNLPNHGVLPYEWFFIRLANIKVLH